MKKCWLLKKKYKNRGKHSTRECIFYGWMVGWLDGWTVGWLDTFFFSNSGSHSTIYPSFARRTLAPLGKRNISSREKAFSSFSSKKGKKDYNITVKIPLKLIATKTVNLSKMRLFLATWEKPCRNFIIGLPLDPK